jgi:HAD superfamily hydrolase (TIGR01484 family)
MLKSMQSLCGLSREMLAGVTCILTDIDDTVTTHGRLSAQAYAALEALQQAGLRVIPITGRPAGWCDMIARLWPVDGVVGENGAFYMRYDHSRCRMKVHHVLSDEQRRLNRARLDTLAKKILADVPGCALASDQGFRVADLAVDFCEDVPPLPPEAITRITDLFHAAGAQAKVSSIHVNGWFGDHDKLTTTRLFLKRELDMADGEMQRAVLFAGDSPNDSPMFAYFPLTVGVANVRRYESMMHHMPRFITDGESGHGFAELVRHILQKKGRAYVRGL